MDLNLDAILKKLGLMRGAKPSAGLVVRSRALELLAMEGRRVAASVRVPIEGDQPGHLTEAIRKALAAANLKSKKLAVALEHQEVLFRCFTLPVIPRGEWDAAIQFEARRYIPFKTESLVWDYRVVQQHAEAKQMEVVFAAVPRESLRVVQDALTAAGVQPTVIEPRSASLARLAEPLKGQAANEFVCLVDVEPEVAHLAIVKAGTPYLTRDIGLLPNVRLPLPDAGAATPSDAAPAQAAEPADPKVQRLLSELSVSMDFFMREYPSTTISRILLCGDRQVVEPWCQWLSGKLSCPVESAGRLVAAHVQGDLEPSFASALGVLQGAAGTSFDFLKRSAVKTPQEAGRAQAAKQMPSTAELLTALKAPKMAAGAAALVVLLAALWALDGLRVAAARRQLSQLVAARPDVGWGLSQMPPEALAPIKEAATAQFGFLAQLMDHRVSAAAKLDALARSLPEGVWVNGLTFQDAIDGATGTSRPRLAIHGACFLGERGKELETIQQFEDAMKRDPVFFSGFSVSQLESISTKSDPAWDRYTYHTFQLNCDANRKL